jgi:hypothetical protein
MWEDRATQWRKDLKSVGMLPPIDDRIAWHEESGSGKVNYAMGDWDPPRRMTTRIARDDLPYRRAVGVLAGFVR